MFCRMITVVLYLCDCHVTNRTTLIYVKFDQDKVDEANRTVIDYLIR